MVPDLYRRAESWYAGVQAKHPGQVVCKKGCFDCCLGLFDISLLDADLLREGLAAADPQVRADIEAKARALMEKVFEFRPDLRGETTLESLKPDELDDLCDAMGDVRCPVLGDQGECRLYEHRPLLCRLNGVPLKNGTGEVVCAEGCFKNSLGVKDVPVIDYTRLRRDERRLLKNLHESRKPDAGSPAATMFIPMAVQGPTSK